MNSHKKPAYLIPPCGRSRTSILEWLESIENPRGWCGDGSYKFCFNVKVYHVDFSFENLVRRHREAGNLGEVSNRWLKLAEILLPDHENDLWEWGIEGATSGVYEDDAWKTTYAGKDVGAEWGFHGRSGGWLCLERFAGRAMSPDLDLAELDYQTLVDLAEMIQWASYLTQREKVRTAVEESAAFDFFVNICESEIESDDDLAARLESERRESLERFDMACRDTVTV